ncbi:MAG: RluA family pseudouridine synthase [Chloroflexi bacterium]|nr:RluA family pseudouridine synthase [Chloroflexota bacterium]
MNRFDLSNSRSFIFDDDREWRLDRYLAEITNDLSRSRISSLIRSGNVTLNGTKAKPSSILHCGDKVNLEIPEMAETDLIAQDIPIDVLFQDQKIMVINKPSGMAVHPGPGHPDGTLVNAVLAISPDIRGIGGEHRPGVVHRLDKDTSGLILIAKDDQAHNSLTYQLKMRYVKKEYLALVEGIMASDEGEVDEPIGRHPYHRRRMAIVGNGRPAQTKYKVLERFSKHTLVQVYPRTGRTHQIRVHLSFLGFPIYGDSTYGKRDDALDRHFLHASRIGFWFPSRKKEWAEFEAPLPPELIALINRLK